MRTSKGTKTDKSLSFCNPQKENDVICNLNIGLVKDPLNQKEDENSSNISISTEFPRPKKKILLSMEVITEEKMKDGEESYISDIKKENLNIKMFVETEPSEKPGCPVSNKIDEDSENVKKMNRKKPIKNKTEAVLISNKAKRTCSSKRNKKKNNNTPLQSHCSLRDIETKQNKNKQNTCDLKKKRNSKKSLKDKETDHVLSFSSGTNLTQTTFDFGFSKLGSCECSLVDKANKINKANLNLKMGKSKKSKKSSQTKIEKPKIDNIKKKNSKKSSKAKKKKSKLCEKDQKCCQCGKTSENQSRKSLLEIPNFIVQPFNKYEIVLKPRNYDIDSRGTLGNFLIFF